MNYDQILTGLAGHQTENVLESQQDFYETTENLPSKATSKAQLLEEKRQAKLDYLNPNIDPYKDLEKSTTKLEEGIYESNANKIWNEYTPEELQYQLGYAASKYAIEPNSNKDARRLYAYGTKDGEATKFGIARGDLPSADYRYQPGRAKSEGYKVGKNGYGWESGEYGVDLNKNQMDLNLEYSAATVMEGLLHGNKKLLEQRRIKNILSDEGLMAAGGKSEYYLGENAEALASYGPSKLTPEREKELREEFDAYIKLSGAKSYSERKKGSYINNTAKSSIANGLAGMGYMLGDGVINTLDLAPELVEYAYKNLTGDKYVNFSDTEGLYSKKLVKIFKIG